MNYGEIKTAIINRSHRSDLTALVPGFVQLAEAEYNRRTASDYDLTTGTDSKSNWVSEFAPDVYIFGGLAHLAVYTNDDESFSKYGQLFERAVDQAHYAEVREAGDLDTKLEVDAALQYTSSNILTG